MRNAAPAAYQASRRAGSSDGDSAARRSFNATDAIDPIATSPRPGSNAGEATARNQPPPTTATASSAAGPIQGKTRGGRTTAVITASTAAAPSRVSGGRARSRTRKVAASSRKPAPPAARIGDELLLGTSFMAPP